MSIDEALQRFYQKNGFGEDIGKRRPLTVKVYTGCLLVPLPNIETRRKYLKYHDLHHIMTACSTGRIGEGKMSAWELGTGSFLRHPLLGVMNLIALSTGFFLKPDTMWQSFLLGKKSQNLYHYQTRQAIDKGEIKSLSELRKKYLNCYHKKEYRGLYAAEFASYVTVSIVIHAIIAIPAVIVRTLSDIRHKGFRQALNPSRRKDLY